METLATRSGRPPSGASLFASSSPPNVLDVFPRRPPPRAATSSRIDRSSLVPSSIASSAAKTSRPESDSSSWSRSLAARLASPVATPSSPTRSSARRRPPRVPRVPSTPPSVTARAEATARSSAPQSRRRLVLVLVGVVLMRSRVRHEGLDHVRRDLHHLAQLANLPLKPGDLAADPDERLVVREDVLPLLGLGEIAQRRELVAQMPHAPLGGVAVELRGETVEVEILRIILGPRVEGLAQLGHRGRGHRGRLCGHRCQLSNIPFCSSVTRLGSVSGFSAPLSR